MVHETMNRKWKGYIKMNLIWIHAFFKSGSRTDLYFSLSEPLANPWSRKVILHYSSYIKMAYRRLSLTIIWFVSDTRVNSQDIHTPSARLIWGWARHETRESGALTTLQITEKTFHLDPLLSMPCPNMGNSVPFLSPNMVSSATRGLFFMFRFIAASRWSSPPEFDGWNWRDGFGAHFVKWVLIMES